MIMYRLTALNILVGQLVPWVAAVELIVAEVVVELIAVEFAVGWLLGIQRIPLDPMELDQVQAR